MIAGAIAAIESFPNRNLIVIDMGTATVINPITSKGEFVYNSFAVTAQQFPGE